MLHLKEGDKAPDIKAKDQFGNTIDLTDFNGSKVILYFYPKDNTPGCSAEACNLRDNYQDLINKGFKIIGVSADDEILHQSFTEKFSLPFPLIPDTEKKIILDYDVWGEKKFMGKTYFGIHRITFVIDENGVILKIFTKVDTKNHTTQILKELKLNQHN
ncbi:MAG: thioredoxin-dependent thiol peroxidase [Bacteroidetes bacterium]|nr:thioredoxin-dependent thiol peroxidase [Bacteroidota bacterium]